MPLEQLTPEGVRALARWAAQECEWQVSGEMSVSRLIDAYFFLDAYNRVNEAAVLELGLLIEPTLNVHGYRRVNVQVGWNQMLPWQQVPRAMTNLLEAGPEFAKANPVQWFKEFEEIHPFRDGNGRTGALLYNWWKGTYGPRQLLFPPNLWDDPRRGEGWNTWGI